MPASPLDSALYGGLFSDPDSAAFFTDSAEIAATLQVEGALARVQGALGLIPQASGAFIHQAAQVTEIAPAALAAETATNGVPVPGLVAAFRQAMGAPEHAQYLHWGATSQDILDTAQNLRLRGLTLLWQDRIAALTRALGTLAAAHAALPMAARSYGQAATPSSFGALVAAWGHPLLRHGQRLAALRPQLALVSLGGAAGTLSAMGAEGPAVRAALARALDLTDPGQSWHAERDGIAAFAAWMAGLCASLGKMGEDLILMSQSGIDELRLAGAGGSSTMPQKQNPVAPSVLVAIARQAVALAGVLQGAALHRQQRDGSAWFAEWLALPQLCILTGTALRHGLALARTLAPEPAAMERNLMAGFGVIEAEAFVFALARHMPRPEAQSRIKALCAEALATQVPLSRLVARDFPAVAAEAGALPTARLGTAPDEARRFARAAGAA